MEPLPTAAAAILVATALAHSYLGERYILMRLFRREDLPRLFGSDRFTKQTLRFAWHITSLAWIGMAGALVGDAPRAIALASGATAIVAGVASRGRHLSWVAFGAVALLAWPW